MFTIGQYMKIKEMKRVYAKVIHIDQTIPYEHKFTLVPFYKPAPKSRLKTKSYFSKNKKQLLLKIENPPPQGLK